MNSSGYKITLLITLAIFGFATFKFIERKNQTEITNTPTDPLIVLDTPLPDSFISSPLKISGKARGNWFFEASFPIILTDWDGKIIAQNHATALTPWMTTEFVPFEAELNFEKPAYGKNGFLILKKDNPSGLPQNDDSIEIGVKFR